MEDSEITDLTIAALCLYGVSIVGYFGLAFGRGTSRIYAGPSGFWTVSREDKENGVAPAHLRWAQVTLKTAPFNGIQSLRCVLQAGSYFAGICMSIAVLVIFFQTDTGRPRLIFMTIGCLAICAIVCFVQHMRFCYHLGFLVMFQQPQEAPSNASAGPPDHVPITSSRPAVSSSAAITSPLGFMQGLTGRGKFNRAVAMHVVGSEAIASPSPSVGSVGAGETFVSSPSDHQLNTTQRSQVGLAVATPQIASQEDSISANMLRHIEAENSFDMYKHTARVAYVVQRHAFNFAMGMRLICFLIPLALGSIGDELLIASTLALLPFMYYMDRTV